MPPTPRLGERDSALAMLRDLEREFTGKPLGEKAAKTRGDVEKWRLPKKQLRRHTAPNEPPLPGTSTGNLP